jgi:hypothetical protein
MKHKVLFSLFLFVFIFLGGIYETKSKTISKSREILKVGNLLPNALLSQYQKKRPSIK